MHAFEEAPEIRNVSTKAGGISNKEIGTFRSSKLALDVQVANLFLSQCFSCKHFAVWKSVNLIDPKAASVIAANDDMPDDIKADFLEAAAIVDTSPRGAAALLRLCLQKLVTGLGQTGKNLSSDIGHLVENGLDIRVQQALDVLRVVGNNAVHPGQIDLRDDKATALKLFDLLNIVVEAMISNPKHIKKMYESLPESALVAIEKRDRE